MTDVIRKLFLRHGVTFDNGFINGKCRIKDNNDNLKEIGHIVKHTEEERLNTTSKKYTLRLYGIPTWHNCLKSVYQGIMNVVEDS